MSIEDKQIARLIQKELNRRQALDTTDVKINVIRAIGYLSGTLRPAMGMNVDMKEEIKAIKDTSRRIPGLKDIVMDDLKYELGSKGPHKKLL